MFYDITTKIIEQTTNLPLLISFNFESLCKNSKYSINTKFIFFRDMIGNTFIPQNNKEEFINTFCKIQSLYHALNRFKHRIMLNKSKLLVDEDLVSNKLDIKKRTTICIYQEKTRYLFSVFDLSKIINNCLQNTACVFYSEPLAIKNPYNNVVFSKAILYTIYFHMIFNTHVTNELFYKLFKCNFNLTQFYDRHESLLREKSIHQYVRDSNDIVLANVIHNMIKEYNTKTRNKFQISVDFPKSELVEIMKPYLLLYLTSKFTLEINKKHSMHIYLYYKLNKQ